MIFTRDFFTRENYWQIASLVTQKSLFTVTHALFFISSLCRCIWKYCASKMLVRYTLSSVCLRLNQFFQLSFMQYMGLCVFGLPISLVMILRIRILYHIIFIKSEVWTICHCLGLGHETMVCVVFFLCSYTDRLPSYIDSHYGVRPTGLYLWHFYNKMPQRVLVPWAVSVCLVLEFWSIKKASPPYTMMWSLHWKNGLWMVLEIRCVLRCL